MNWVVFSVLTGLVVFNLLGVGLYHYQWKQEHKAGEWKCKTFALWTAYLFVVGICYVIIRLGLWIKGLWSKKDE